MSRRIHSPVSHHRLCRLACLLSLLLLFSSCCCLGGFKGAQYDEIGVASWYGHPYHGRKTANGETYNMDKMTAAHQTLPFGTKISVTNLETGKKVKLRINDRGPFVKNRILDVSRKAAHKLGLFEPGTATVGIKILKLGSGR